MTPTEFAAYLGAGLGPTGGVPAPPAVDRSLHEETEKRALASLPTAVDWQQYGCVTSVKSQSPCNTCVAFATTAAVESAVCIRSGAAKTLADLSVQDQVSCGIYQGDCMKGQFAELAFDWMARLNGGSLCTADSFPLITSGEKTSRCLRYEREDVGCTKPDLGIVGYDGQYLVSNSTVAIMQQLAQRPVAAEMDGSLLQYYSAGVLMGNETQCFSHYSNNHVVLLTGYGEEAGVKYWRAKNSCGAAWGDQGYFKIEREFKGSDLGACGIESSYHYPVFASDAPFVASRRSSPWKRDVQLSGTLIDKILALTELDCSEKCRVTNECQAYSFNLMDRKCSRLSNVSTETRVSSYVSGRILTRAQTDQQCLAPESHVDFPGNDIRTAQAPSYTECCDLCNKVDNCGAYTWTKFHGGSCYLKSNKGTTSVTKSPASGARTSLRRKCTSANH